MMINIMMMMVIVMVSFMAGVTAFLFPSFLFVVMDVMIIGSVDRSSIFR